MYVKQHAFSNFTSKTGTNKNNKNKNLISHRFNCPTHRNMNRIKPNNTTLTTAEHTFQVHPLAAKLPHQPWLTHGWYMPPFIR